jgi:anti-sigma regulatory factor (Ser/Thr protein kinase)
MSSGVRSAPAAFAVWAAGVSGLTATGTDDVELAISEAVANAIEHGRPCKDGWIHVRASISPRRLTFRVLDGVNFAPAPLASAERGRGLAAMAVLMDEVTLRCSDGQTLLALTKLR